MLELGLHFSSAMNSVCGLRFSIPYLAGQLPCCSPLLLSPFQVRPMSRSDYRTGAIGLLGFYRFYRFYLYRAFRPLDFYRLCYSYFRLSVYVVFYISDVNDVGLLGLLETYWLLYYDMKIIIIWVVLLFYFRFYQFIIFWKWRVSQFLSQLDGKFPPSMLILTYYQFFFFFNAG